MMVVCMLLLVLLSECVAFNPSVKLFRTGPYQRLFPRAAAISMSHLQDKTVLVTGASSGIGAATAVAFADHGVGGLVLAARRKDRLEEVRQRVQERRPGLEVQCVELDVTDVEQVLQLPGRLKATIDVLVNNAGLAAGLGPLHAYDMADMEVMVDTNIKGVAACCRAFVPGMLERGSGHVINLSSIAGKQSYGGGALYCATKYAVEAITDAVRTELVGTDLRVTTVSPGFVDEGTEFSEVRFKGDKERAREVYTGLQALSAADVADAIVYAASRPPHVQVADIYLLPTNQAHPFPGGTFRK